MMMSWSRSPYHTDEEHHQLVQHVCRNCYKKMIVKGDLDGHTTPRNKKEKERLPRMCNKVLPAAHRLANLLRTRASKFVTNTHSISNFSLAFRCKSRRHTLFSRQYSRLHTQNGSRSRKAPEASVSAISLAARQAQRIVCPQGVARSAQAARLHASHRLHPQPVMPSISPKTPLFACPERQKIGQTLTRSLISTA